MAEILDDLKAGKEPKPGPRSVNKNLRKLKIFKIKEIAKAVGSLIFFCSFW